MTTGPHVLRATDRTLYESVAVLYGIQGLNWVAPLVTTSYLARTLGPSAWGTIAFAESFGRYSMSLVEYGFQLSAVRDSAAVREDPHQRGLILGRVLGAQVLLLAGTLLVALLVASTTPAFGDQAPLLCSAVLWGGVSSLSPLWYFRSIERLRLPALVESASRLVGVAAIVIYIQSPANMGRYFWIQAVASACGVVTNLVIAYRHAHAVWPRLTDIAAALRDGFSMFIFRSSVSLYTVSNVLILGLFAHSDVVAVFAGAEKITKAAANALQPVVLGFYPRITYLFGRDREKAHRAVRLSGAASIGLALLFVAILVISAPVVIPVLLGPGYGAAVPILRWLTPIILAIAISNLLGIQIMLPLRMDRAFNVIICTGGLLNLILSVFLAPAFGAAGMAWSVLSAEYAVSLLMYVVLRRRRLTAGLAPFGPA